MLGKFCERVITNDGQVLRPHLRVWIKWVKFVGRTMPYRRSSRIIHDKDSKVICQPFPVTVCKIYQAHTMYNYWLPNLKVIYMHPCIASELFLSCDVRTCSLSDNNIDDAGIQNLAEGIKHCPMERLE